MVGIVNFSDYCITPFYVNKTSAEKLFEKLALLNFLDPILAFLRNKTNIFNITKPNDN